MPVALLPPLTSTPHRPAGATPLTTAPRYVRGPGNSRWHRPRSGYRSGDGHTLYSLWCGPYVSDRDQRRAFVGRDEVNHPEPVCGTCVGRALGVGQDDTPAGLPELVFSPRWISPPRWCPGSRSERLIGEPPVRAQGSVGLCLACGDLVAVRGMGRPYDPRYGLQQHEAGPGLVTPCPWHAWQYIVPRKDGTAGCSCGWPAAEVDRGW